MCVCFTRNQNILHFLLFQFHHHEWPRSARVVCQGIFEYDLHNKEIPLVCAALCFFVCVFLDGCECHRLLVAGEKDI